MAYEQLKKDIIDLLKCKDNTLELKMYNSDGMITLDTDEVAWLYIPNREIVITMPNEESEKVILSKNDLDFKEDMQRVLRRIRRDCNLNGVDFIVRKYNGIDKRKVYNIVKQNVYESAGKKLAQNINSLKGFKVVSDAYMPLEMQMAHTNTLIENTLDILSRIEFGSKEDIAGGVKKLFNEKNVVNSYNQMPNELKESITKNIDKIDSAFKFVKNQCNVYGRNISKNNIVGLNEWLLIMKLDESAMKSNLQLATDKLANLALNAKTRYDVLKIIRDNNLCENYMVSKEQLIDSWLAGKTTEEFNAYLLETYNGKERIIEDKYKFAVTKAEKLVFESKGEYNFENIDILVEENKRLDNLMDFVRKYKNNKDVSKYFPSACKLCQESIAFFNNSEVEPNEHYSASNSETVALLEVAVGESHPAFDEIVACYEMEKVKEENAILEENKRERNILMNEFQKYFPAKRSKQLTECILGKQVMMLNQASDDVKVSDNVSMGNAQTVETLADEVKTWKNNFYTLDPVLKKCLDNYMSCKCYQTEEQLSKFKPVLDILQKYTIQ